ncbi:MAG: glycosyltransferase [Phycisphaerae bacterium]
MRVMLLVTDLEFGGTPLRLARLGIGLRRRSVDVVVGCLASPGPVSAMLERHGVRTFACRARGARDWRAVRLLMDIVRCVRPALIHATLTHANVAARLVGALAGVPVLTSTATIEVERRWHAWIERATARLDRGHVVNSRTLAEHAVRVFHRPRNRVYVVPASVRGATDGLHSPAVVRDRESCGAPTEMDRPDRDAARRRFGITEHEFAVFWVGRLDPVKRVDLLVRVAEIMNTAPTRIVLVGDGPERAAIERLLSLSSAKGRVTLAGWHDDLADVWAAADAFVLPSRTEGMPNALLEAMAAAVPAVASDIPSIRELQGDPPRLLLATSGDAKSFADALEFLRANPAARRELGARAAASVWEKGSDEAVVSATLMVYRRVLRTIRASASAGCG